MQRELFLDNLLPPLHLLVLYSNVLQIYSLDYDLILLPDNLNDFSLGFLVPSRDYFHNVVFDDVPFSERLLDGLPSEGSLGN